MKLVPGGSLAGRLAEYVADPKAAARLLATVARAVHHAHQRGILHRDLKPANLFVSKLPSGNTVLKVLDFGISKLSSAQPAQGDTALTGAASSLGSPHYMAPEQMLEACEADQRSDIWSLGVVLHELLVGTPPWEGANAIEVCAKVLSLPPPSVTDARPDVPHPLVRIVERCLEKEPGRRYADVSQLGADLRRVLQTV
jgi:serine/threonine-protein kinase